jgi:hypothetical protein
LKKTYGSTVPCGISSPVVRYAPAKRLPAPLRSKAPSMMRTTDAANVSIWKTFVRTVTLAASKVRAALSQLTCPTSRCSP